MDNKEILTISIPTYNRENFLKSSLDRLLLQVTDEVKIVVRDNASTNYDFWKFSENYKDSGVEFYRNDVNIGGDANIARAFETCTTKWLWVLGDDDVIEDDAILNVLKILHEKEDSIYVKFNWNSNKDVVGLVEFANLMTPRWSFGTSFFISECIHNIATTSDDMHFHYRYLSTSCGQILRVMRHLIDHPRSLCSFVQCGIIKNQCCDSPSWSYVDYAYNQIAIFDIFKSQRSILKGNIFKDIITMCYTYISDSDLPLRTKIEYLNIFAYKHGLVNMVRYNSYDIFRSVAVVLLGNKNYRMFMSLIRSIKN